MASHPAGDDPRRQPGVVPEGSIMPTVARPPAGLSTTAIVALAVVAGLILFAFLNARREAAEAPAIRVGVRDGVLRSAAPPPTLYVPPEPAPPPPAVLVAPPEPVVAPPPPPPQIVYVPQPAPVQPLNQTLTPPRIASGPTLVIDNGAQRPAAAAAVAPPATLGATNADTTRARAGMLANRTTTVPQGSLISAVLETGFNSSRPGFARAIVSRDISSFDGARVLIPRGSRLIGEYGAAVMAGQNRALINWTRLIRPDGATINLGSPATDPVGRSGVKASVNDHFFERFGGAILQSVLDVGVNLASRSRNGNVIVALPNSVQGATTSITQQTQIPPTLKVAPGRRISVFVARDLDFTVAEATQ